MKSFFFCLGLVKVVLTFCSYCCHRKNK
uniref:Uncharacterized protein n=1 Tax=Anguilla anguilla TaxID=7936 RepID=A0A0E9Y0V5_ANGAN